MTHGAGKAPPLSNPERSFASSIEKDPDICVLPPVIAFISLGALYTTLSIVMATTRPTLSDVISAHLSAPSTVIERSTVIPPDCSS